MSCDTPTYTPPRAVAPLVHPLSAFFSSKPQRSTLRITSHVVRVRCCSQRSARLSTGICSNRLPPPWEGPNLINQPHPDPALLTTEPPSASNIADDAAKVNVVSSNFKKHPATTTSTQNIPSDVPPSVPSEHRRYLDEVEAEGFYLWSLAKQYVLHPAVGGGLLGLGASRVPCRVLNCLPEYMRPVVNIGLISGTAYTFYTKPHLRRETRAIVLAVAGALTLLGAEGFAAEKYYETPHGQREAQKAKREGAVIYRHARETLLRPGVLGGLLGVCGCHTILP